MKITQISDVTFTVVEFLLPTQVGHRVYIFEKVPNLEVLINEIKSLGKNGAFYIRQPISGFTEIINVNSETSIARKPIRI